MKYVFALLAAAGLVFAASGDSALPNFHQVNNHLFRGAQPSPAGFRTLAHMGIKTVIDLREESHAAGEEKIVEAEGMRYISLPMNGLEAPSDQQVEHALALIDDAANGPVFVHCHRGADRTGTVVACYRIAHEGWENRQALDEARGFGMSWMEFGMHKYVLHYHTATASSR
ncbi:MAG TPA: tyrosine-protein phosphatase [Bryobacteraceae bacterium]|jgi:protein tyrosine/serine phosphatase|nr:tyrosine-protein phosphatase [Bryobacteraceae bacterium]